MLPRPIPVLANISVGLVLATLTTAASHVLAQNAGKSSRLPITAIQKSDSLSGRQNRLNPRKGDKAAPAAPPEQQVEAGIPEPEIDPLDLLVPSDPHVDPDPAPSGPVYVKPASRYKERKPKSVRRPIDIAFKKGKLHINRFHTVKLDMEHKTCRDFPNVITTDYELPPGSLDTLADNLVIVQKRLCASNGSIMVTCYQNRATISLRRARPDDGCS